MKKTMNAVLTLLLLGAIAVGVNAAKEQESIMTKEADGTYVVNTTSLCKDVKGYRSTTPLTIHIKNGKVVKIEALRNQETPKYFTRVKKELLSSWDGVKVNKAIKMNPDAVTGATMSSDAVKENVKRGLQYYESNK